MSYGSVRESKRFLATFQVGTSLSKARRHYRNYIDNRSFGDFLHCGSRGKVTVKPLDRMMRWRVIYIFGGACAICGDPERLEVHHIVPRSRCGTNDISNLVPLCHDCHCAIHEMSMMRGSMSVRGNVPYAERFCGVLSQDVAYCNGLVA